MSYLVVTSITPVFPHVGIEDIEVDVVTATLDNLHSAKCLSKEFPVFLMPMPVSFLVTDYHAG